MSEMFRNIFIRNDARSFHLIYVGYYAVGIVKLLLFHQLISGMKHCDSVALTSGARMEKRRKKIVSKYRRICVEIKRC